MHAKSADGRYIVWNDGTSGGMTVVRDKAEKTVTWYEDDEDAFAAIPDAMSLTWTGQL